MRRLVLAGVTGALAALSGALPAQEPACPFLPQFETLRDASARAAPADALGQLYAYFADPANENPAACEAFEIERLIGERERALVSFERAGHAPIPADAAYHCNRFDPRTTQCNGVVADDTGHSNGLRMTSPIDGRVVGRVRSALPGARLVGLYRATLGDDFGRRPATRLNPRQPIAMTAGRGEVLIALYAAPAPFKFRKLVWYF